MAEDGRKLRPFLFTRQGGKEDMRFRPCIDIHNGKVKQIVGEASGTKGIRPGKTMYPPRTLPFMPICIKGRDLPEGI